MHPNKNSCKIKKIVLIITVNEYFQFIQRNFFLNPRIYSLIELNSLTADAAYKNDRKIDYKDIPVQEFHSLK